MRARISEHDAEPHFQADHEKGMRLFGIALARLTTENVEGLVANHVGESRALEFKLTLPGKHTEDKKEFLADVSARRERRHRKSNDCPRCSTMALVLRLHHWCSSRTRKKGGMVPILGTIPAGLETCTNAHYYAEAAAGLRVRVP